MTTRELAREMAASYAAMTADQVEELVAAGVPVQLIDFYQMIGTARIRVSGDCYEPDHEHGALAFISPVLAHHPDTPEAADPWAFARFGNILDLLAWDPRRPDAWALRTGSATWLGCIEPQYLDPAPVRIWRTPLDWFRANCVGLVILTLDRAEAYRLLTGCVGGIVAADQQHAAEIRNILDRPFPRPRVVIMRPQRHGKRHAA